jgi:hypothetical protein
LAGIAWDMCERVKCSTWQDKLSLPSVRVSGEKVWVGGPVGGCGVSGEEEEEGSVLLVFFLIILMKGPWAPA